MADYAPRPQEKGSLLEHCGVENTNLENVTETVETDSSRFFTTPTVYVDETVPR